MIVTSLRRAVYCARIASCTAAFLSPPRPHYPLRLHRRRQRQRQQHKKKPKMHSGKRLCCPHARRYIRARSALGPFGARLSGLSRLSVHSPLSPLPMPPPARFFLNGILRSGKKKNLVFIFAAYQQPIKYNFAVTREVLKACLYGRTPTASYVSRCRTRDVLYAVARARSIGYWRDVVRSGEYARLGVYALEAYGIFKVRFSPPFFILKLSHWAMCCSEHFWLFFVGWRDRRS